MARSEEIEHTFPSTTWQWKLVKMSRPPKAPSTARAQRARLKPLARRNPRESLTITVKWRGGPECWWEIVARGRVWRAPGHVAIHDVLARINNMPGQ